MYKVNPLPRMVLAVTDEVIALGATDQDVDARILVNSIQIAEDRFAKQMIGKEFYDDFRQKKNVRVTDINKDFLQSLFPAGVTLNVGELVNAIELVDNEWYVMLWNEYLWKIVAESVVYTASPSNYSRYTARGEMQNNPQVVAIQTEGSGSASVDLKTMQWKLDKILMDRIDPLRSAMHEWICDNITHFPLYPFYKKEQNEGVSLQRKTPWVFVYDNNKKSSCHE